MLEKQGRWGTSGSASEDLVDGGARRIRGGGKPFWEYCANDLLEVLCVGELVAVVVSAPEACCGRMDAVAEGVAD